MRDAHIVGTPVERLDAAGFRSRGPLAEFGIAVFGMTALVTPLALWIAWSTELLLGALAAGMVSIAACWLIVRCADAD
ncbi:MAG: hypothetical protein AAF458_23445 [Pseudomonadota bacterium]